MKIYISGKISGLSEEEYEENFANAERNMVYNYQVNYSNATFINPLDIEPFLWIKSWCCYMASDLWQLRKCDTIAMQKNWIDSRGATIEYYFAKWIFKLQIIFL